MRSWTFLIVALLVAGAVFAAAVVAGNDYYLFAGYVVLQFVVLATAWNILGGYCGYVNFGSAAFYAVGAYSTVALHQLGGEPDLYIRYFSDPSFDLTRPSFDLPIWLIWDLPLWLLRELFLLVVPLVPWPLSLPTMIVIGGAISGAIGLGMGYLTLRLRGVFFAIATLALAVVLQTFVVNWDFVGGARGAYIIGPHAIDLGAVSLSYIQYLFLTMLLLSVLALFVARLIERSRIGLGFATIRDDEAAAEASGVPTLRLKVFATTLSGALMGMAGAPFPYYVGYVEPLSAFGLPIAVNSIAMPMIGGTTSWAGPLVGAILLGTLQQIATVTISSAVNLLIVGVMLVAFVIAAPVGIVGLTEQFLRSAAPGRLNVRAVLVLLIAGYCFVIGILAIIFNLAVLQSGAAGVGVFGVLGGALYVAAAYGLLKLQRWAPLLTIFALVVSVAQIGARLAFAPVEQSLGIGSALVVVVTFAAVFVLLNRKVRVLYNPPPGAEPGDRTVPA